MTRNTFRSLQIGDQVSLTPGYVNTVTNQYIRVIDGKSRSFVTIDHGATLDENSAYMLSVKAMSHPVVINTDGFESQPCCYTPEGYTPTLQDLTEV